MSWDLLVETVRIPYSKLEQQVTDSEIPPLLLQTPFHSRVADACEINLWEDWKGYTTPAAYSNVELEYFAMRNSASIFDITPMTKYRITGTDGHAYLDRLVTRNLKKLDVGRVMYTAWCNDEGKVIDDGTIFHINDDTFILCSQERHLDWLEWSALGFDVKIEDVTEQIAALSFQGPTSCAILKKMDLEGVENLKPFDLHHYPFQQTELMVSRTGFTADLGYELWISPEHAENLWDALMKAGEDYNIKPVGSEALQIARVEAGFIQAGVEFVPAEQEVRVERSRSPYELGLGWLVHLKKSNFNGQQALKEEKLNGSRFRFTRLDVQGNKPAENSFIFNQQKKVVGMVTSAAWVPTAKRNIAFASLEMPWGKPGDELWAEIYYLRELKWARVLEKCTVLEEPIFDPERRHATPALDY
ncbi:MAG: glycine cleavage system protein T [Gammaproteobacteria bacterium]|jgi:aminomethyltransferase|nr:glycine cleavage system protein T [Gammaproteobacteria bacterium]